LNEEINFSRERKKEREKEEEARLLSYDKNYGCVLAQAFG
jgi:hypothetical protein